MCVNPDVYRDLLISSTLDLICNPPLARVYSHLLLFLLLSIIIDKKNSSQAKYLFLIGLVFPFGLAGKYYPQTTQILPKILPM